MFTALVRVTGAGRLADFRERLRGLLVRDPDAEGHTYFRYREGALALIAPDEADGALEEIAFRLVDEWLWYDEEDAALERARYAHYGYPVRGANLKSEKIALLRRASGPYSTLG